MKSNISIALLGRFGGDRRHLARNPAVPPLILAISAALMALLLLANPCRAEGKADCKVAVAALSLPAGSKGLLHWRVAADSATTPLQLSTRYFSKHLKLPGNVIAFYDAPVAAAQSGSPPPEPLLRLTIPAGSKLTYIVLWAEQDANQQVHWRAKVFEAGDWPVGSVKLLNASTEALGISADKKQIRLEGGKNMNLLARDWPASFPMKIYRLEPTGKLIFSSTWRIAPGRRELCLVGTVNGSVTLRSLVELGSNLVSGN